MPLTGPYGTEAQDQVRCAQLAVAEFNEAGGLNGQKAELLVRDDKLDPGEAATRTLELIERDKVNYIVGSLSASVQLAVNNVTKQRKVLYNSISQSDQITAMPDWSRYTFHEGLTPHMTAGAVGAYAFPKFGKRVAFLSADYAYGAEMVAGFKAAGEKAGIDVVAEMRFPLGTTDFSTLLPRIQALKPDVLCLTAFGRDQQISVRQATDFGLKRSTRIVIPVLLYTARVAGGPTAFDGVIGGTSYYWGLESSLPSAKAFNERYRKAYEGKVPSDYGALGYAGVRAVLAAVKEAGTVGDREGGRYAGGAEIRFLQGAGSVPRLRPPGAAVGVRHREQEQGHGEPVRRVRRGLDGFGGPSPGEELCGGRAQLMRRQSRPPGWRGFGEAGAAAPSPASPSPASGREEMPSWTA